MRWGFGIEKESAMIGYKDNLESFKYDTRGETGQYTHDQGSMRRLGANALSTSDITVFGGGRGGSGYEFVSDVNKIRDLPKQHLSGFAKDVEKRAKSQVLHGTRKRTLPFGSVPGVKSGSYGGKVPGSYHLNLTMPFKDGMTDEDLDNYKKKMKNGLLNVRAIQPLILALTGGTTEDSIGNPNHLEGSQRQIYASGTSGIGFASLKNGADIFNMIDSPEDSGRQPTRTQQKWRNDLRRTFSEVGSAGYTDFRTKRFERKVPTIEMRFLDTFDTRGLYGVFSVIATAMANGDNSGSFTDPATNEKWNEAMKSIASEGWNAKLDIEYAKYLKQKMKLDIDLPNTKTIRADLLMELINKKLWEKNKDDNWVKPWIPERAVPKIHNFNKDSWEFYFIQKLKESPSLRTKFEKLLLIIDKLDTSASPGNKIKVQWKGRSYGLRDIILDDEVMGFDFGAEDTGDILHLMERYGFIKTFSDASGNIVAIKKLYSGKSEIETLLTKMLNEKHMLNEAEGGLLEIDYETEPIPATPPPTRVRSTTPIPRQRPSGTVEGDEVLITERGAINNSLLRIRTPPSFALTEDAGYNRDDMQEVFSLANFKYQNVSVDVTIKYADITYDNRPLKSFWKRNSPSRVVLYLNKDFADTTDLVLWVDILKSGMYSVNSVSQTNIFASGITVGQFFTKLKRVVRENYAKRREFMPINSHSREIKLTKAGIETLRKQGVGIGSINNGERYVLVTKQRLAQSSPRFTKSIRMLKYIPYYKDYSVEINGQIVSLKKDNKIIDKVRL